MHTYTDIYIYICVKGSGQVLLEMRSGTNFHFGIATAWESITFSNQIKCYKQFNHKQNHYGDGLEHKYN